MAVGDAHVFPGTPTPALTLLFSPKPSTTFLRCYCRGRRRKYAGKKVRLNQGLNSQPPGHESDTLITELHGRGNKICVLKYLSVLLLVLYQEIHIRNHHIRVFQVKRAN